MGAAEKHRLADVARLSWVTICEQCPCEWVALFDVEHAPDGSIRSGRVAGHDRSMRHVLAQIESLQLDCIVAHTAGRPLHTPRVEMTDEIRDIVRARR